MTMIIMKNLFVFSFNAGVDVTDFFESRFRDFSANLSVPSAFILRVLSGALLRVHICKK